MVNSLVSASPPIIVRHFLSREESRLRSGRICAPAPGGLGEGTRARV